MSKLEEQKIPKGSYAAGRMIRLPEGAEPPIVVYINGVAQTAGLDYNLQSTKILFTREIIKEELSAVRKSALLLGLFGTYRKNETVDIQFQRDGKTELAGDLKVES